MGFLRVCGLPVYVVNECPRLQFTILEHGKKKIPERESVYYCEEFLTLDIETSTLSRDLNIMYVWMVCYNNLFCVYGRTWDEFMSFMMRVKMSIPEGSNAICFIHNLSYEFQYIRGLFDFTKEDVFCLKSRKVLRAFAGNIEFRCSYLLSNLSLSNFCKKYNTAHKKLDGDEFDYSVTRYPWTELTNKELEYCITDTVCLAEAIIKLNNFHKDNWYTMPLTSTGFVRRKCKNVLAPLRNSVIRDQSPTLDIMLCLKKAFRGGNTHANRYYSTKLIGPVWSYDIQSSYPAVIVNERFPMTKFVRVESDFFSFKRLIKNNQKALLFTICIENVKLSKEWWGFPYIPVSKCRGYNIKDIKLDNGRILEAKYLEISLTDIDYKIICEEYNFSIVSIRELYISDYGILPKAFRELVISFFKDKTELKGVAGQEDFYMLAKEFVNSIYGMMVQDPLKSRILYDNYDYIKDDTGYYDIFNEYIDSKYWIPYQWGVWVTAWARRRLEDGLIIAGEMGVYCDTDSIKAVEPLDFSFFNEGRIKICKRSGGFAYDRNGKIQYMGIFDDDGKYTRFVTFGAKKYCFEKDGEVGVTISGVGKKKGAEELKKAGGLDALHPGFVFTIAGGLEAIYHDITSTTMCIMGVSLYVTPNVSLVPSTYTLGLGKDYNSLLKEISFLREISTEDLLT